MARYEHSIDVNVPVRTAYNQWTQFEEFPMFMEGVEEVRQMTDTLLHWKANIIGHVEEWDAKITEQSPDQRVAWTSINGAEHAGVVTFHHIDDNTSRIMLQIDYEPKGVIENIGTALGVVKARMAGDLQRFKEFIEARGVETGAWRGEVQRDNNR
ncbi:MAG: SRPBCC family protein [bacterium]|nr:SRPBCC family protein [bacterium]